jgi:hypothetical protein
MHRRQVVLGLAGMAVAASKCVAGHHHRRYCSCPPFDVPDSCGETQFVDPQSCTRGIPVDVKQTVENLTSALVAIQARLKQIPQDPATARLRAEINALFAFAGPPTDPQFSPSQQNPGQPNQIFIRSPNGTFPIPAVQVFIDAQNLSLLPTNGELAKIQDGLRRKRAGSA